MNEENFGPLFNEDGSPSDFTKQMFDIRSPKDERDRLTARIDQMRKAILNDFSDEKWFADGDFHGHVLEATRQCIVEMAELGKRIRVLNEEIVKDIKDNTAFGKTWCRSDCGCHGAQLAEYCKIAIPSCERCWTNGE
jgi:hypothetical protein